MNLEEIKKRTKILNVGSSDKEWAADTILQLVAELERINKVNWQKWNDNDCDQVLVENEQLTAANKIMRDKLVDIKSQLDVFKCGACSTAFSTVSIDNTLAEVDEALK